MRSSRFVVVLCLLSMLSLAGENFASTPACAFASSDEFSFHMQDDASERRVLRVPSNGRRRRVARGDRRRSRGIGAAYAKAGREYGRGGKRLGRGAARFGKRLYRGRPIVAGRELGRGAGGFGKGVGKGSAQVGVGTARVGKRIGRGAKRIFRP